MIDLYWWATSNGHKATICLEELELDYRLNRIDITAGDQDAPAFQAVNPNGKIPAIVDHAPADGGAPQTVIESAAILIYLAEKAGRLLPNGGRDRLEVLQWTMWQAAGFGPMLGQAHHFNRKAPEDAAYARDRYNAEARRLYAVLEERLDGREHVAGDYSIADIMILPWTRRHEWQRIDLAAYPNVHDWQRRLMERPAIQRAYALAEA
ncbi:MAG: glutathione binding-like protein [Shimia sp.]